MSEGYMNVPATLPMVHTAQCCPAVREVLSRVGDKWSVLVVVILSAEPLRFNELRSRIDGISQRMLTRTLQELTRDGLLSRRVEPTVPPKVEYALTELGRTLLVPVEALATWARENQAHIHAAQEAFDKKALQ